MRQAYERGETDEFIKPTLVGDEGQIREGDAAIFFNFRPDRARQLTSKLGEIERRSSSRRSPSTTRTGTTRSRSRRRART